MNGLEDHDVASYYNYMVSVAVLLGADRETASRELKESLMFEIQLATASQAREKRRNATRLYNPMMIKGKCSLNDLLNVCHLSLTSLRHHNQI